MKNDNEPWQVCKHAAFTLLTRRDYSAHALTQRLQTRGYTPALIQQTLTYLTAQGLINDERYTEQLIHRSQQKGIGPKRIGLALKMQGITNELVTKWLHPHDVLWLTIARQTWQKRFKGIKPTSPKERLKQIRFLQYRGFSDEHIHQIVNTLETTEAMDP